MAIQTALKRGTRKWKRKKKLKHWLHYTVSMYNFKGNLYLQMAYSMGSSECAILPQRNQCLLTTLALYLGMLLWLRKYFVDNYCTFKTTIRIFFLITSEFPWFVKKNIWVSWAKNGFSLLFWSLEIELLSWGHLSVLLKSLWVLAVSILHSNLGSETDHGKSNWLKSTGREKDTEFFRKN